MAIGIKMDEVLTIAMISECSASQGNFPFNSPYDQTKETINQNELSRLGLPRLVFRLCALLWLHSLKIAPDARGFTRVALPRC
jgi:hypothetical protein